ncbi:diguanylate cyclase domain-containing protein [Frankia nepalensis]|uniref:diguanylate cyclase domain-containing protein n=1 Tax=Frankia nepalensis TaxID=1836974 RepID=UPI0027DAF17A|nr:diguanylate cyclase [Frankia nepalensis]
MGAVITACANAIGCLVAATCLVWTGWRARGADRRWRLITGLAAVPLGLTSVWHVRWAFDHGSAVAVNPPTAVDAALLIVALSLAGLLTFPTDPLDSLDRRIGASQNAHRWYVIMVLDSLVVVGAVALLVWSTMLKSLARAQHIDTSGLVSYVVATIGYMILLSGVVLLSTFRRPRSRPVLALLGAGLSVILLCMTIYLFVIVMGGRSISPAVDVLAAAGWTMILLACLVPVPRLAAPAQPCSPQTLWIQAVLPYLAIGAAGGLAAIQLIVDGAIGSVETYVLLGLLLLIMARQMTMLGENTRLLALVRRSQRELHHQAFHDPLTGLANRALFADRLEHTLASRDSGPFALAFCDLDDFKRINDTLGHAAGDELLRITAARLRDAVRSGDTVARLGGDEFALLLEGGGEDPEAVCRRLATTIRTPCTLMGHSRPIGASLGLVLADPTRHPAAETLLRDADLAMYEAKRAGKGGLVVYSSDLSTPESAPQMRADLDRALRADDPDNALEVRYRPVVDLRTWRTVAVETIPCWSRGHLREPAFEPLYRLADEAGLAMPLLDFIFRRVCRDMCARGSRGSRVASVPVFVTVPIDRDLEDTPVAGVADLLADRGLPARSIILTLMSGHGLPDLSVAAPALRRLGARDIRLALDGAGGDQSTLAAWYEVPIQIVRLDRRLTRLGDVSTRGRIDLVREALLALAARLGLTVVATGLDAPAQARSLAAAGCHLGTGPLCGPPRPMEDVFVAAEHRRLGRHGLRPGRGPPVSLLRGRRSRHPRAGP